MSCLAAAQPRPELVGRRERRSSSRLEAGQEVELDDAVAVGGVGELQAEDGRVVLRLLQPVAGVLYAALASTTAIGKSRV